MIRLFPVYQNIQNGGTMYGKNIYDAAHTGPNYKVDVRKCEPE